MDGGTGQKRMSDAIKQRIKQSAAIRRERRRLSGGEQSIIIVEEPDRTAATRNRNLLATSITPTAPQLPGSSLLWQDLNEAACSDSSVRTSVLSNGHAPEKFPSTVPSTLSEPFAPPSRVSLHSSWPVGPAIPIHMHLGSVMIYLDHVFPFLFPFYQPHLIETGRQWLLGLLCQNEVSFHLAASLSAYFFALVPQQDNQDMHDDCKALVKNRLVEQMDLALSSMQSTVSAINCREPKSPLLDMVRVMEEVSQLLIVEVTVRSSPDWQVHLTPALVLFDEIFKTYGTHNGDTSFCLLFKALPTSMPAGIPHNKPLPNTADQSACIFFVTLLLFIDIVASTCLGRSPSLQTYHQTLLSSESGEESPIKLEAVFGCHDWALMAIADISALCAWKRDARQNGKYSVVDLVDSARPISKALDDGLASISAYSGTPSSQASGLEGYYTRYEKIVDQKMISIVTQIWAYAARIYLSVTLSGWQTNASDIQASVAEILSLLQTVKSPAQLRSLSWPICIAGCVALPAQDGEFRNIINTARSLREFGTLLSALQIMEAVWRSRGTLDGDNWDIASSLTVLGTPALLV
jgi:C6 transcription factor Pro1